MESSVVGMQLFQVPEMLILPLLMLPTLQPMLLMMVVVLPGRDG